MKGGSKKGDSINHPIIEEEEQQQLIHAQETKSNPDAENIFSKVDKKNKDLKGTNSYDTLRFLNDEEGEDD